VRNEWLECNGSSGGKEGGKWGGGGRGEREGGGSSWQHVVAGRVGAEQFDPGGIYYLYRRGTLPEEGNGHEVSREKKMTRGKRVNSKKKKKARNKKHKEGGKGKEIPDKKKVDGGPPYQGGGKTRPNRGKEIKIKRAHQGSAW